MTMLDDLDRIVYAAQNGDPLTKLEILALADAYQSMNRRVSALEGALDIAETMIGAREAITGTTQPLKLTRSA